MKNDAGSVRQWPPRYRPRTALGYALAVIAAVHLGLNAFNNARIWRDYVIPTYEVYTRVPPERKVFVKTVEEHAAIINIRALLPEDARILWMPDVWRMANYYVYPRKIFQTRVFKPGEEITFDRDFMLSRRITHVYIAPDRIFPVRYDAPAVPPPAQQQIESKGNAAGKGRPAGAAGRKER